MASSTSLVDKKKPVYKLKEPQTYDGRREDLLDSWLFQVEEYLKALHAPEEEYVLYATTLLRGYAAVWWQSHCTFAKDNRITASETGTASRQKCINSLDLDSLPRN